MASGRAIFRLLWPPACYIIAALQIWGEHKGWLEGRRSIDRENFPVGDCVPESHDGGKTWCADYSYIQAHPELPWKTVADLYVPVYAPLNAKDGNVFLLPWERLN